LTWNLNDSTWNSSDSTQNSNGLNESQYLTISSFEDRIKSFEFWVTVNLHLTGTVHFYTLLIFQKVLNNLILDKKCVEIKLSKILSLRNIYSAV